MALCIGLATGHDADQIAAIYAPVVRNTAISFELEPPTIQEMEQRIQQTLRQFPWLVCEQANVILGYVYASPHRARPAYQWSVDTTVYVHHAYRGHAVGRALYTALLKVLPLQGYYNAYAGIALPNAASVGLHEAVGFEAVGVYHHVGYKLGQWHDVGWWQVGLQAHVTTPTAPLPLSAVQDTAAWHNNVSAGLPFLRL